MTWWANAYAVDICVLSNIDDSIQQLEISSGYELLKLPTTEILNTASQVLGTPIMNLVDALPFLYEYPRLFPNLETSLLGGMVILAHVYVIRRITYNFEDTSIHSACATEEVYKAFQIARLMNNCNPCFPISFQYVEDENDGSIKQSFGGSFSRNGKLHSPLHLTDDEWGRLNMLKKFMQLPFNDPILNLAHQSFELSYHIGVFHMEFLSVMIGLETLMGSDHEISHQIARNVAVLLSDDKVSGERIYSDIKKLYNIRSKLVHTGQNKNLTPEKLFEIRNYLGQLILKIAELNIPVIELKKSLNASGYGDFSRK